MAQEAAELSHGPSCEELLGRVAPLLPRIKNRAGAADLARDLPRETIDELVKADLFRLFQPRRWGGFESDPRAFFAVQNAIARVCPSTAWVYGVLGVQSFLIGLFDEQAQADVWGENGQALIGSAGVPAGIAETVDGGFRLSGRWTFSSGISHAQWVVLGAMLPQPAAPGPPARTACLVPREELEIVDVWHSFGLRATGSNDVIANDVFVPAHRTFTADPGIQNVTSEARPGPSLYRLPWLYLFTACASNFSIGTAQSALDGFLSVTRSRVSIMTGKSARDDPAVMQAAGRLAGEIDAAEAMYDRHVRLLLDHIAVDTLIPMPRALLLRTQLTATLRKLTALVDDLMMLQGARATDLASPVTRPWLDLTAARTHLGNDPTMASTMLGAMLIGQE